MRTCIICRDRRRDAIEQALLAGEPLRTISAHYGPSKTSLIRHKADHLPSAMVQARAAQDATRADNLLQALRTAGDRSERLYGAAKGILEQALTTKDLRTALLAIQAAVHVMREARGYLELKAEVTGELTPRPQGLPIVKVISIPKVGDVWQPLPMLPPLLPGPPGQE